MDKADRHPDFGREPWIGPGHRPVDVGWTPENHGAWVWRNRHVVLGESPLAAIAPAVHGQDTLKDDISRLNDGLDVYMSYVDNYGGWPELVARFGSEHEWKGKPWGYTSAGNAGALNAVAGGRDFVREFAHYGHGPHVCGPRTCGYPQADWTQWDDVGPQGQNVDQIIGFSTFGNGKPALVSITIFGGAAMMADMEPGAMSVQDFPHWYDHVAVKSTPKPPPKPHPHKEDGVIAVVQEKDGTFVLFQENSDGSISHCKQLKPGGPYTPLSKIQHTAKP